MKLDPLLIGWRGIIGLALAGCLFSGDLAGKAVPQSAFQERPPARPQTSTAKSARQIAQNSFPSVVLLLMDDANGQPVALGSGFFVAPSIIATNFHVIEGASRGHAKIVGQKAKFEIAGVVAMDPQKDLVLLSVNGARARALEFGDSRQAAVGDEVYAVGNPEGLEGTFSQGIVSGIRQIDSNTLLQITAPISPGSSGGPVLNFEGKVIGVAVATLKGGQNLNFAIPTAYLASLLARTGPVMPLTASRASSKQQTILAGFGSRSTEAITGAQIEWLAPILSVDRTGFSGYYTFSLRNGLGQAVQEVYCLVIFSDAEGKPVDVDEVRYSDIIPAGLAKRAESHVDPSVPRLATSWDDASKQLKTRVEFRVLDFRIAE